jgi:hypothetical protein
MDYTKVYYIKADIHREEGFVVSFSIWSYKDTPKKRRIKDHRIKTFPIASDFTMNSYLYRKQMSDTLFHAYDYMQHIVQKYSKKFERYGWTFCHNSIEFTYNKGDKK